MSKTYSPFHSLFSAPLHNVQRPSARVNRSALPHPELLALIIQSQRQAGRVTNSRIHDPALVHFDQKGEMINFLWDAAMQHVRRKYSDLKTHFSQQACQQSIQLVTKCATFLEDDLIEERHFTQDDVPVEVDIEISRTGRLASGRDVSCAGSRGSVWSSRDS